MNAEQRHLLWLASVDAVREPPEYQRIPLTDEERDALDCPEGSKPEHRYELAEESENRAIADSLVRLKRHTIGYFGKTREVYADEMAVALRRSGLLHTRTADEVMGVLSGLDAKVLSGNKLHWMRIEPFEDLVGNQKVRVTYLSVSDRTLF